MEFEGGSFVERQNKIFTTTEALNLAKAWVHQSRRGPNQDMKGMWDSISNHWVTDFKMSARTPASLRIKWTSLQREVQIYLAACKEAGTNPKSGTTAEDIDEMAMSLYKSRAGKRDENGKYRPAVEFKYIEVSKYLEDHPKFGGRSADDERVLVSSAVGGVVNEGDETSDVGVRHKRARGFKSAKRDEKRKREESVVVGILGDIRDEMKEAQVVMENVYLGQSESRVTEKDFMLMQCLLSESTARETVLQRMVNSVNKVSGAQEIKAVAENNSGQGGGAVVLDEGGMDIEDSGS